MSFKRLFVVVLAAIATTMFVSCDNLDLEKTLKGTTWTAEPNDELSWVLKFKTETSVVITCYEDGSVEGTATGTYTYASPTVNFSFSYDGFDHKFNAKVTDNKMYITWIDDYCDIDVEGLVFNLN